MANDEYELIPGTDIWVRDITESFAVKFAETLEKNASILNFPRLRFPLCTGYSTKDYLEIARGLRNGEFDVYETRDVGHFNAKFISFRNYNFFVVTHDVSIAPLLSEETLIHEATHAIQDLKQWRMSPLDMEVDAHFSAAIYATHKKNGVTGEPGFVMDEFMNAAKNFDDRKRFGITPDFRRLRKQMKSNIIDHYWNMKSIFESNSQTKEEFTKNFKKRKRLDG